MRARRGIASSVRCAWRNRPAGTTWTVNPAAASSRGHAPCSRNTSSNSCPLCAAPSSTICSIASAPPSRWPHGTITRILTPGSYEGVASLGASARTGTDGGGYPARVNFADATSASPGAQPPRSEATAAPEPRVCLAHDYLLVMRGAERTFAAIADMYPRAPIFTLLYDEEGTGGRLAGREIVTSSLQRLGVRQSSFRRLLPLYPRAIERLALPDCELVLSSSSAFAHGVRATAGAVHVCYCHAPFRYAWYEQARALAEAPAPLRGLLRLQLARMRRWDLRARAWTTTSPTRSSRASGSPATTGARARSSIHRSRPIASRRERPAMHCSSSPSSCRTSACAWRSRRPAWRARRSGSPAPAPIWRRCAASIRRQTSSGASRTASSRGSMRAPAP